MKRRLTLAALALCASIAAAEAQTVQFVIPDTTLIILTSDTGTAELHVIGATGGISSYDITLFFDSARVRLVDADSVPGYGLASPTLTFGTNQVTLVASGGTSLSTTVPLATLFFEMAGSAVEGSLVSVRVNALLAQDGVTDLLPNHRVELLDVCQATQIWGDLDESRVINSRDALIAMTAAVGLPIGAFDATVGDVDEDTRTTSRDALFILSHTIGLTTITRIAKNRANRCAPLYGSPADLAFWNFSDELLRVDAGDTVVRNVGYVGYDGYSPAWAPDGSRILVSRSVPPSGYWDLVAVARDGSTADTLNITTTDYEYEPAWSPDGTTVAFVRNSDLFLANRDGTNPRLLATTDAMVVQLGSRVSWSPSGEFLAFAGYAVCCTNALWTVSVGDSLLREVFTGSNAHAPREPAWSAAGDSLIYDYPSQAITYRVAAPTDAAAGAPASRLTGGEDYADWVSAGIIFRSAWGSHWYGYYLREPSGRYRRITRDPGNEHRQLAAWKTGLTYVQTVTVSGGTTISVSGTPDPTTTQLSTTVLDNGSNPITPLSGMQWKSSDPAVASVSTTGLVTAQAQGTATITATAGGWRSGTIVITVNP